MRKLGARTEYNDGINGPITYTFSQPIAEFSMKVWGAAQNVDIGPGHYMLAYDAVSGGNLVDSVSFGPGVNNIYSLREDIRTVSASAIRRVVVQMPRLGPDGNGDYSIPVNDRLRMRQATFLQAPCPPKDSLLDDKAFRDSLKAVLDESNANDPIDTNRKEHGYALLQDRTTGEKVFIRSVPDPNANNCGTKTDYPYDAGRYKILATGHSHPYRVGEIITRCGNVPHMKPYFPIGSDSDWKELAKLDSTLRSSQTERVRDYIIDKLGVIRLDPTNGATKVFLHSQPGCRWYP